MSDKDNLLKGEIITTCDIDQNDKKKVYVGKTVDAMVDMLHTLHNTLIKDDEVDQTELLAILMSANISSFAINMANILHYCVPLTAQKRLMADSLEHIPDMIRKNLDKRIEDALKKK